MSTNITLSQARVQVEEARERLFEADDHVDAVRERTYAEGINDDLREALAQAEADLRDAHRAYHDAVDLAESLS